MDQRRYERINIHIEGTFYVEVAGRQVEFTGILKDISEGGVGIQITNGLSKDVLENIEVGTKMMFQSYDEYELLGEKHYDVISSDIVVVRKMTVDDNIIIGCTLLSLGYELDEYIKNRKLSLFMDINFN